MRVLGFVETFETSTFSDHSSEVCPSQNMRLGKGVTIVKQFLESFKATTGFRIFGFGRRVVVLTRVGCGIV